MNGKIYPGPPWNFTCSALSIRQGRVAAFGEEALQDRSEFSSGEVIDVAGAAIFPGFIDSHVHLTELGASLEQLAFPADTGPEEIRRLVARETENKNPGEWIVGGQWSLHSFPDFPNKTLLDSVAPAHPVALYSKDLHSLLLNSRALELLRINTDTPDPENGVIMRDTDSRPTGVLREHALQLFEARREPRHARAFERLHTQAADYCLKRGITTVHSIEIPAHWQRLKTLAARGTLQLRVGVLLRPDEFETIEHFPVQSGQGDDWCWLIGVKIFADGALGSRSAWLKTPYEKSDDRGMALVSYQELMQQVSRAHQHKLSVGIHAIGDAAVEMALQVLLHTRRQGAGVLRDRIEHFQLIDPADCRSIPSDLFAAVQPVHMAGDRSLAEEHWGERSRFAFALHTLQRSGVHLCFGSDAPVEEADPWKGIQVAVTRRTSGVDNPWNSDEQISLAAALTAYTYNGALAAYRERVLGSLHVGTRGDAVVLSEDPFRVQPEQLSEIKPIMTIVGGKVVYTDG